MTPRGHSLVELIVSLAVLGIGSGAVAATALLGTRWSARGAARQEALALAVTVLDSLLDSETSPAAGAAQVGGVAVTWTVIPLQGVVRDVRVEAAPLVGAAPGGSGRRVGSERRVVVSATWTPPLPVLPSTSPPLPPAASGSP